MSHRALGQQFDMPLADFRQTWSSGEHDAGPAGLRASIREMGITGDEYLDRLKAHVQQHGIPGEVLLSTHAGRHYIEDGHHRAVVAHELGIDPVPVRFMH